jgi:hypothetical protein
VARVERGVGQQTLTTAGTVDDSPSVLSGRIESGGEKSWCFVLLQRCQANTTVERVDGQQALVHRYEAASCAGEGLVYRRGSLPIEI